MFWTVIIISLIIVSLHYFLTVKPKIENNVEEAFDLLKRIEEKKEEKKNMQNELKHFIQTEMESWNING